MTRTSLLHRLLRTGALVVAVGCAPPRPVEGGLTPARARTTNEIAAADAAAMDALAERLRLQRMPGVGAGVERAYAGAAAAEWLAFARDAYAMERRSSAVDEAFAAAATLVSALEAGNAPRVDAELLRGERLAAERLRFDLWVTANTLHADTATWPVTAPLVGEAEVTLVRAAHAAHPLAGTGVARQPCEVESLVDRAVRLLSLAMVRARDARAVVVAKAPTVVAPVPPPAAPEVKAFASPIASLEGAVHFALASAELSRASTARLDSVALSLSQRGPLRLVIEGYTDPRGSKAYNAKLSRRRAEAVARYLSEIGLDLSSASLHAMGAAITGKNPSREELARARRVNLRFFAMDGKEIESEATATDLQVESVRPTRGARAARAPRVSAPRRGAKAPTRPAPKARGTPMTKPKSAARRGGA